MLLFIDEPRNVKIVRQESDGGIRVPLGKIKKQQLVISEEVLGQLKDDEVEEVEAAFDLVNDGEACRIKAMVSAFPATTREVLSYYKEVATPIEQRWILGALIEGLRMVRRYDRAHAVQV